MNHKNIQQKKPWRINFSSGLEFNPYGVPDRTLPLFFVNFSDHDSDRLISRQPLSIGALLETRAVASELNACEECTAFISESLADFKTKLQINLQEKTNILYNKGLTTYTAPAHLLSFFCDIKDPLATYAYGAALANIALNLTAEHFQMLRSPESFFAFGKDRVRAFCERQSCGYAFAAIARQAPKYSPESGVDEWLNAALHNSNLPSKKQIFEEAKKNVSSLDFSFDGARFREIMSYYRGLAKSYLNLMERRTEQELFLSDLFQQKLLSPILIDEEGELFAISKVVDEKKYVPECTVMVMT